MKTANELITEQIEYAWEEVVKVRQYILKNNELPQIDDVAELFER
jgi:hypothetical protein